MDAALGADLAALTGGAFVIGTDTPWIPNDGEGPARAVDLSPFRIARRAVDVAAFARFVDATGYVTDAERIGWSFVFAGEVDDGGRVLGRADGAPWWLGIEGASWRRPGDRHDALASAADHPVVHVSWNDACAYCRWGGFRLPTEAEWEYAASAGQPGRPYPWGEELAPGGVHHCNVWQGSFPTRDTGEDGFRGKAPVDAFAPNAFGLFNVIGNVWEWCADVHDAGHDRGSSCCAPTPAGVAARVQKGGSYLCHHSYCARYRVQARIGSSAESSTGNVGFRVAADGER
jgi:formylglycine-generating enzyme